MSFLNNPKIRGRLFENFGLGFLVNGMYGVSDGSFEIYNLVDIILGIAIMLLGLYLQQKADNG